MASTALTGSKRFEALRRELEARVPELAAQLEATAGHAFVGEWTVPGAPADVWSLLSDTSRLNRQLRIPAATFDERFGERTGRTSYFGVTLDWVEPPWEWHQERMLLCEKRFSTGPAQDFKAVLFLEEVEGGTRMWVWYGWTPRGLLSGVWLRRANSYLRKSYDKLLPRVTAWLEAGHSLADSPLVRPRHEPATEARQAAERMGAALVQRGFDDALVAKFFDHVLRADALDLVRIRVRELAPRFGVGWRHVLELALAACRVGALSLSWDVVCPHCRGVRMEVDRLGEVPREGQCEACDVAFATDDEGRVELTFRVHEALRRVEPRVYCAAEAGLKPHVRFQVRVPDKATRELAIPLAPGRYVLRRRDFSVRAAVAVDASGEATLEPLEGARLVAASPARFELEGQAGDAAMWLLETIATDGQHVGPGDVLSMADYRDLLGDDALAAGVVLSIGKQHILFTDMVGSTAMYRRLGDHEAFRAVNEHFAHVRAVVRAEGGAVVKTIGDAVMAAFPRADQALRAAEAVHEGAAPTRCSLHCGTCLAVNADTGLDYFGAVVNVAAKLQLVAAGGETAMSRAFADEVSLDGRRVSLDVAGESVEAVVLTTSPSATHGEETVGSAGPPSAPN